MTVVFNRYCHLIILHESDICHMAMGATDLNISYSNSGNSIYMIDFEEMQRLELVNWIVNTAESASSSKHQKGEFALKTVNIVIFSEKFQDTTLNLRLF